MYTVCYTNENGQDVWERCESRNEVADPDVLIFTPEADDETIAAEDIFTGI